MSGQIVEQRSSYQRGLVLGLTMAEIMILLVFCLLIAMATFLKREETQAHRRRTGSLNSSERENERTRDVVATLQKSARSAEKFQSLSGLSDPQAIDQYWRELVDSRTVVNEIEKSGVTVKQLREGIANIATLRASGIDADKAIRDSDLVAAISRAMAKPGEPPVTTQAILDAIARGMAPAGSSGHQWPPIIRMSEADGYFFKIRQRRTVADLPRCADRSRRRSRFSNTSANTTSTSSRWSATPTSGRSARGRTPISIAISRRS